MELNGVQFDLNKGLAVSFDSGASCSNHVCDMNRHSNISADSESVDTIQFSRMLVRGRSPRSKIVCYRLISRSGSP